MSRPDDPDAGTTGAVALFRAAWETHRFVPEWPINLPDEYGPVEVINRSNPGTASPPVSYLRNLRTGDWLDRQVFPPVSWAVPGLVPEGMTLLVGGPKIGKSWLSLDIALAVASGGLALGSVPVGAARPVLLLALEDGDRRLQDRARELLAGDPIPARLHYLTRIEPGAVVSTIREWLDLIEPDAAPLIVLDTLGRVMPPAVQGESTYQRDYRVSGSLKRITDEWPGLALLVLHHDRKAQSDDFVDAVSGTNGIAGAADTVIVLARPRTEDRGLFKVTGRDVVEQEYAVTVTGGHWSLIGGDLSSATEAAHTVRATANLSDRSAEIVRFVNLQPNGVRAADVAAFLDVDDETASRYLRRLHDAGRIDRPARGLYTPVRSVRSVRSSATSVTEPDAGSGWESGHSPGYQAQPDTPDGADTGVPS